LGRTPTGEVRRRASRGDFVLASREDGSIAKTFFQATQHGMSSFGEKWFLLNGNTQFP